MKLPRFAQVSCPRFFEHFEDENENEDEDDSELNVER
jgi:hypothetical protein